MENVIILIFIAMQETKRSFRARPEHKTIILEEAERNPIIITQKFTQPNARSEYNKSWVTLTAKLNSLGYGEKTEEKWRRVLIDWISCTKAKWSKIKRHMEGTGGGPYPNLQLSPQEERLMAIKGYTSVEGDGATQEMGIQPVLVSNNTLNETIESDNDESDILPETSVRNEELIRICIENDEDKENDRKKQKTSHSTYNKNKTIQQMHEETLNELKNINNNLKIISECMVTMTETIKKSYSGI